MSTHGTRIVALFDPVLDALCVEEVLLMASQPGNVLFVPKVLPAYNARLFSMVKASSEPKLADILENIDLMIEVLKPTEVYKQVMAQNVLENEEAVHYY